MSHNWRIWIRWLLIAWTSPNSMLGLTLGVLALLSGGKAQVERGCIEFHGGFVKWALGRLMGGYGVAAMTLGHTILGQTPAALRTARDHEHVHVRQYERWGPFFLPAYLGSSLILWLRGCDCYLENPFEVEAYRIAPLDSQSASQEISEPREPDGREASDGQDETDSARG